MKRSGPLSYFSAVLFYTFVTVVCFHGFYIGIQRHSTVIVKCIRAERKVDCTLDEKNVFGQEARTRRLDGVEAIRSEKYVWHAMGAHDAVRFYLLSGSDQLTILDSATFDPSFFSDRRDEEAGSTARQIEGFLSDANQSEFLHEMHFGRSLYFDFILPLMMLVAGLQCFRYLTRSVRQALNLSIGSGH